VRRVEATYDPFVVLGVSRTATTDEVKSAYRRIAKETHPDLHGENPSNVKRFTEATEAYAVLSNSERRAEFERSDANAVTAWATTKTYANAADAEAARATTQAGAEAEEIWDAEADDTWAAEAAKAKAKAKADAEADAAYVAYVNVKPAADAWADARAAAKFAAAHDAFVCAVVASIVAAVTTFVSALGVALVPDDIGAGTGIIIMFVAMATAIVAVEPWVATVSAVATTIHAAFVWISVGAVAADWPAARNVAWATSVAALATAITAGLAWTAKAYRAEAEDTRAAACADYHRKQARRERRTNARHKNNNA